MRRLAALLLAGLFSTATLASCTLPKTDSSDPDTGTSIDGLRACIDACLLSIEPCVSSRAENCGLECFRQFMNAGPQCQDELNALYACALAIRQAQPPTEGCPDIVPNECDSQRKAAKACVDSLGCENTFAWEGWTGPNGEEGCRCEQQCAQTVYIAECWYESMTTYVCDCSSVALGSGINTYEGRCEDPGRFCEGYVYRSCCNQFFMLPL